MKKIIIYILIISSVFIMLNKTNVKEKPNNNELRGCFISYIELTKYIKNYNIKKSKENIKLMIKNINDLKLNTIILQIRSFNDSIYKSNIFPWSKSVSIKEGVYKGYDILDYFIKECQKYKIKVIGWINPYRVNNLSEISKLNPAYKYINTDYLYVNNGVYLNPSKKEIEDLIVKGVEEVINNYKLDGILFDDYFYPNNSIDIKDYHEYISKNIYMTINNYHLMIINRLIKRVHEVCKKHSISFGISPDGNIENNYNKHMADIYTWLSSNDYVDFIMPQLYYGFFNESKDFINTSKKWSSLIKNKNIKLYIALSFYKNGKVDKYAKKGIDEWVNNNDIIMKEIIVARNLKYYQGFSLFRYDYIFNKELYTNMTIKEIENIKKILK